MKRQPKSFVVEIKRSSRKTTSPAAAPIWDVAALLSSVESDAHAKSSQAAASALFRAPEPEHALAAPQPERRILPVIAPEPEAIEDEPVMAEPLPQVAEAAPDIDIPVPSFDEPHVEYLEFDTVEPPAVAAKRPAAPRHEAENVLPFTPETVPGLSPRRGKGERDLPRGERWKRRLPKIMR